MPKVNTLMSYFTPKSKDKTLRSNRNSTSPKPKFEIELEKSFTATELHTDYVIGDIVWGRVVGYPWWPGIICNEPNTPTYCRKNHGNIQVHVQFFDEPPSRAWLKEQSLARFEGGDGNDTKRGGRFFSPDKQQRRAIVRADEARGLELEERLKLTVAVDGASGEISEESAPDSDTMECDDDSFIVASDESLKENRDADNRRKSGRTKAKRRRIKVSLASEEESGDEFKPASSSSESGDESSGVEEVSSEPGSEPETSPVKRKRKKPGKSAPSKRSSDPPVDAAPSTPTMSSPGLSQSRLFSPQVGSATKSRLSAFTAPDAPTTQDSSSGPTLKHLQFDFLKPSNLRDMNKRAPSDPDYDPRSLYIPDSFLKDQTPAMRQWWEIKRTHFDTVLFFKMGKFYELFHMDASIAVTELGIVYMKGDYAHAGFPEISYGRYADTLIQRGFKVARIEQTETPDMMEKRVKAMTRPTKFDKVVKREVCRVTTKATKTFSFIDGTIGGSQHDYLLAIAEKVTTGGCLIYGVCFVDTSIGKFQVGQFSDDRHCSRLRTLLAHHPPARVLYERGHSSEVTQQVFKHNLGAVPKEALVPRTEFWDSGKALKRLAEGSYFSDNDSHQLQWPECFQTLMSSEDTLGLAAADDYDLAVRALGAITWYLEYSLLDQELLSLGNISLYYPSDVGPASVGMTQTLTSHMVVDGVAMTNLEILTSSQGTLDGTLLQQLDHCHTAFGKRLLRHWLCSPLCNRSAIEERQDAIDDLANLGDITPRVIEILKKLPDLERLLSKIHSLGSAARSKTHPDSRAILFEEIKYSKRKIEDFLSALTGFESLSRIPEIFHPHVDVMKSRVLRECVTTVSSPECHGNFPDLSEKLNFFDNSFDQSAARKNGVIIPTKGVDAAYDDAVDDISDITRDLDVYLEKQKRVLSSKAVTYWGTGRNRYQLEVPETSWKNVPEEYVVMSSRKGWKRYRTPHIEKKLKELDEAEERKAAALKDTMRTIFHSFSESYSLWDAAIQCVSLLDVIMSLSVYSRSSDAMCRPQFVLPSPSTPPYIEIREGRHPCIRDLNSFIPNDTLISAHDTAGGVETDEGCVVIVTGPNMGGKSTLMRQVGLIVMLAQMGCRVPADRCCLTPVDRIFTRLGASDRIMAGESTFFVELSETSSILQHATRNSLVIMDELGRGTATYDGTAIAGAVVNELSTQIRCRTLFSTHYHSLVKEFSRDPTIRLAHMSCMVETDEDDPSSETITFLYKLAAGPCPKSYGFNAAKLANIPDNIISVARRKAQEFEDSVNDLKLFQHIWSTDAAQTVRTLTRSMSR